MTETAIRKARREEFRRLVATTPRWKSLGFGRDKARKAIKKEKNKE